jgi:hypothetical protein
VAEDPGEHGGKIPVLGEAVAGTGRPVLKKAVQVGPAVAPEVIEDLHNELVGKVRSMAEAMLHTAIRDAEAAMVEQLSLRLESELPEMIREILQQRLAP